MRVDYDPNINTAVDAVRRLSGSLSHALIAVPALGVHLLGGLEHPKNWADLLPDEITDVLAELRHLRSHVLVNIGSCLEEYGYDTPGRHSVARAVVAAADLVIVAADPSPIGIRRLSKWMIDAAELTDPGRVHAVFNRSSAGPDYRREIDTETRRTSPSGACHTCRTMPASPAPTSPSNPSPPAPSPRPSPHSPTRRCRA